MSFFVLNSIVDDLWFHLMADNTIYLKILLLPYEKSRCIFSHVCHTYPDPHKMNALFAQNQEWKIKIENMKKYFRRCNWKNQFKQIMLISHQRLFKCWTLSWNISKNKSYALYGMRYSVFFVNFHKETKLFEMYSLASTDVLQWHFESKFSTMKRKLLLSSSCKRNSEQKISLIQQL